MVWLLAAGCASTSTRGDVSSVHELVQSRSSLKKLKLPALEREPGKEPDPEVARLLGKPLSEASAVRIALLNNRALRMSLQDLGVARGALVGASVLPNPEFEASVRFSERDSVTPVWDLGLGFDITRIILRGTRAEIAEAELDAARVRVAGATLDLAWQTRIAFYELAHAERRVELEQTALQALTASAETARALHEAGNITALDLANQETAAEAARAELSQAEALRMAKRERLAALLNVFDREISTDTGLQDATGAVQDLAPLEAQALDASLELAEARALRTAADRRIGLAEDSGSLPELHLGVTAERDDRVWSVGPAISGSLPLFDQNMGGGIASRAQAGAAAERIEVITSEIRSAVRLAREHVLSAQARAKHYRDTLIPLREKVLRETLLQYNAMQLSVFQVLQARREQAATAAIYLDTLLEYWRARAELDQLLAGRLVTPTPPLAGASSSMPSGAMQGATH